MPPRLTFILLFLSLASLLTPSPITSLTQPCSVSTSLPTTLFLTTSEQLNLPLSDLFSGNNLHITLSSNKTSQLLPSLTKGDLYELSNGKSQLSVINVDNYGLEREIILFEENGNGKYWVQEWMSNIDGDSQKQIYKSNIDGDSSKQRYKSYIDGDSSKQRQKSNIEGDSSKQKNNIDGNSSKYILESNIDGKNLEQPQNKTPLIGIGNLMTTKCFSVKYLNELTAIVDCQDINSLQNFLYVVDLNQASIANKLATKILHNNSLFANNRQIQLIKFNYNQYILRTVLLNDYNYDILHFNKSSLETYTEILRLQNTFTPLKITLKTLPPIQYPLQTEKLQAISLVYNNGKIYILDAFSKELYEIDINLQGMNYYQKYQKVQLQGVVIKPLYMETSKQQNGPLFVVYEGTYGQKSGIFMETINPNTNSYGAIYLIDPSCTKINQILIGSNQLVVSYSVDNKSAISIYLTYPYAEYQKYGSDLFSPMVYQEEINSTIFQIDSNKNIITAIINNPITNTYNQQSWQLQIPQLVLSSKTIEQSQNLIISCTSNYHSLNTSTIINPITQSQSNITLTINYVAQDYAQTIVSPFGKYSGENVIPSQSLDISFLYIFDVSCYFFLGFPGSKSVSLDQFYIGAMLDYTIQLQSSSLSPIGWSTEKTKIYKISPIYSNTSTFAFNTSSGSLSPSDIHQIYLEYILPDYYIWVIVTQQAKIYTFLEREGQKRKIFNEIGKELSLTTSTGLLTNFIFFSEDQFIYTGITNPCQLHFTSPDATYTKTLCDSKSHQIRLLTSIHSTLFLTITPFSSTNQSYSQLIILSPSNKTFKSEREFNRMFFYAEQFSSQRQYKTILKDWIRKDIIYVQDQQGVAIYNSYQKKFINYLQLFQQNNDQFCIAVTFSSLIIIQPQSIQEYSLTDLANIYQIRSQFPYYTQQQPKYEINANYYTFSYDLLYIYDSANQIIQIYRTGEQIPMIYMLYDSIPFTNGLMFLKLTEQYEEFVEQLTAIGGNTLIIYNIYKRQLLSIEGYFNQTIKSTSPQTYKLSLIPVQSISKTQQPAAITFTITTKPTPFTNITYNESSSLDFLNLNHETTSSLIKNFNSFEYFKGTVNNYYLTCIDHPNECNTTIIMANPLGPQHLISSQPFITQDIHPGYQNFSFVQTFNRIYRITGSFNLLYDMVQLPFINQYICTNLAVNENGQYSVSACTDFTNNGYNFYISSYISSEPHIIGNFLSPFPQNINRMIILNNYLFIIDALFKGTNYFKGIHIYKLNFEEGFGGGNAAMPQELPSVASYIGMVELNTTFGFWDVIAVDIVKAVEKNQFRLFFTSESGSLLTFIIDPTLQFQDIVIDSSIYKKDLLQIIQNLDPQFKESINENADTIVAGTKSFASNITTQTYSLIIAFRYLNMYELSLQLQSNTLIIKIITRYQKYAFYEFQNNIQVVTDQNNTNNNNNNNGFVLVSGFLPSYLSFTNKNHSQHLFIAYDRTNLTFQKYQVENQEFYQAYAMASYPFQTKNQFKYMAKSFTTGNYAILLINPDDYYLYGYYLQRKAGIQFKGTNFQTEKIIINAKSEFKQKSITVQINKEFGGGSGHKYWIIGAVLGPVAFLVLCFIVWKCWKKKNQGSDKAYQLEEDQ